MRARVHGNYFYLLASNGLQLVMRINYFYRFLPVIPFNSDLGQGWAEQPRKCPQYCGESTRGAVLALPIRGTSSSAKELPVLVLVVIIVTRAWSNLSSSDAIVAVAPR